MADGEDYLWRPVMRGLLTADKLLGTQLDLAFIAMCNEAIDVEIENKARTESWLRAKQTKR
jgi:hypothetical protein